MIVQALVYPARGRTNQGCCDPALEAGKPLRKGDGTAYTSFMYSRKRRSRNHYRSLGTACGAVLLGFLAAAFLLSRGLPVNQVVAFTLFGGCIAVLLGFAANLAIEDSRRYGTHSH